MKLPLAALIGALPSSGLSDSGHISLPVEWEPPRGLLRHMTYRSKFRIGGIEKTCTLGEAVEMANFQFRTSGLHHAVEDSRSTKILYTTEGTAL